MPNALTVPAAVRMLGTCAAGIACTGEARSLRRNHSPAAINASENRAASAMRTPGPKMPCSIEKRTSSRPPNASRRPPAHTAQRVPSFSSSVVSVGAGAGGAGTAASGPEGGATAGGGSGGGVAASGGGAGAATAGVTGTWVAGAGASGAGASGRWRRKSSSSSCSRLSRARTPLSWSCSDATPLRALMAISKAMKPTRMTRNSIPTVPRLRVSRARAAPARIMPRQGQPNVNQQPSHLARNCGGWAQRLAVSKREGCTGGRARLESQLRVGRRRLDPAAIRRTLAAIR